jgi:Na+/proline symporter/nitrogen-specific signal transduction histidine kinase
MSNSVIILFSLLYLALLFGIAYYAEHKLKQGNSIINNAYVYALSLGVYCTAWTYYGSVGRATTNGVEFLAIYIGPTIMAALFFPLLRKIIRITKAQRINSIADFISTRYGKNATLAAVVSIFCIVGVLPYIALQLKAITISFDILTHQTVTSQGLVNNNTLYFSIFLAIFIIIFGTRSVDATEKHEGLVAAVAFESIIKLVAFLVAGIFITYGIFNGFNDIFNQAANHPEFKKLFTANGPHVNASWFTGIILSMMAVLFLPRQFQVSVIENVKEEHLKKAVWLFPLYLLIINVFVLPIALGGKLILGNTPIDADTYVLALPLAFNNNWMGLLVFIGGFSAATSMIIVETIALSTMVSNNLVMPVLFAQKNYKSINEKPIMQTILNTRRLSIVLILLLAYLYDQYIAQYFSLVSIGLISFTGVAQFAPAILGGIYWKTASKNGALAGIVIGFCIWFYTLIVPSMANAHLISNQVITNGFMGVSWLKPQALFGLTEFDNITHALFWSMLFNCGAFFVFSVYSKLKPQEVYQAEIFVDIDKHAQQDNSSIWRGTAYMPDIYSLLESFLGKERTRNLIQNYANRHKITLEPTAKADPRIVSFAEKILAGVIGSASARIMVSSVTKEEELSLNEVFKILHESQQMMELNKELRKKSIELTKATEQLKEANLQLKTMDELKDEFLYTVTHELRTPLTSIRSLTEIVHDNPDLEEAERAQFLGAVVKESERLSHLITKVLNLEKYESGKQKLNLVSFDINHLIKEVISPYQIVCTEKNITLTTQLPNSMLLVHADKDLIQQVMINLIGNAIKFTPEHGKIGILVHEAENEIAVSISDSGKGIESDLHELIFDKFFQAKNQTIKKPEGTGLGLAICRRIIAMHQGKIWVESEPEKGARFTFTIPNFAPGNSLIEHNESSI